MRVHLLLSTVLALALATTLCHAATYTSSNAIFPNPGRGYFKPTVINTAGCNVDDNSNPNTGQCEGKDYANDASCVRARR